MMNTSASKSEKFSVKEVNISKTILLWGHIFIQKNKISTCQPATTEKLMNWNSFQLAIPLQIYLPAMKIFHEFFFTSR
jgi:hypothetical protein